MRLVASALFLFTIGCGSKAPAPPSSPAPAQTSTESVTTVESGAEGKTVTTTETTKVVGDPVAVAATLNDEGVALVNAGKFLEASEKFRAAVAGAPEPRYYFNLCTALFGAGLFRDANTACKAGKANAPAPLVEKLDRMLARIRQEAAAQKVQID